MYMEKENVVVGIIFIELEKLKGGHIFNIRTEWQFLSPAPFLHPGNAE